MNLADSSGNAPCLPVPGKKCTLFPRWWDIRQHTLTINVYDKFGYVHMGLGTVVSNKRTIVTAEHVIPQNVFTSQDRVTLGQFSSLNHIELKFSDLKIDYSRNDDIAIITLPSDLQWNINPAFPAHYNFKEGEIVSMLSQTTIVDFHYGVLSTTVSSPAVNRLDINGDRTECAFVSDPSLFINSGDSGGGVFHNGLFVGVVSSTQDRSEGRVVYVSPYYK